MVIPFAMLAILAFVVMRSLRGVVAHEDTLTALVLATDRPESIRADDDGRGLLLPAATDRSTVEQPDAAVLDGSDRASQLG